MSNAAVNKALKRARQIIMDNPHDAINILNQILRVDNTCVNAYILMGKALILVDDISTSKNYILKAIELDPLNLNSWKGYYSIIRNESNFPRFMDVTGEYCNVLIENNQPLTEIRSEIDVYMKKFDIRSSPKDLETFYKCFTPGNLLAETLGVMYMTPQVALTELLKIEKKRDSSLIKTLSDKLRLSYDIKSAASKLSDLKFEVFSQSEIDQTYAQLINITHDDSTRRKLEVELLEYKHEFLLCVPLSEADLKAQVRDEVITMINDLILVHCNSYTVWNFYFNFNDFASISDIEVNYLVDFLYLFPNNGLAHIISTFLDSDISPLDMKTVANIRKELYARAEQDKQKYSKIEDGNIESYGKQESTAVLDKAIETVELSEDEMTSIMLSGFKQCKDSILAHRIMALFFYRIESYDKALTTCQTTVEMLMKLSKTMALNLPNTKRTLVLLLAQIHTYYEAPKNFPVALQLYDNILKSDPNNLKAKLGKSLVFMEERELEKARELLTDIVAQDSKFLDAALELGWCEILMGEFCSGRERIVKNIKFFKIMNQVKHQVKKSTYLYRIAQSYIYEAERIDSENEKIEEIIKNAHQYLKESLITNNNNASSFTSMGLLYLKYYKDEPRALKCFFKGFELDSGEIEAARYLVEDLTANADWESTEILCQRIVDNEKSRKKLRYLQVDKSWPYRVLGIACLESQRDTKAVEYLQSSIRLNTVDIESWVCLGETYLRFGRLEAAIKVFNKAISIDKNHWHAKYMLGVSQCLIQEFESGVSTLRSVLENRPGEECVIIALYEALISCANSYVQGGFYGRAIECCLSAVEQLQSASKINYKSLKLWYSLSSLIKIFLQVKSKLEMFPFEEILEIFKLQDNYLSDSEDDHLQRVTDIDRITLEYIFELIEKSSNYNISAVLSALYVLANKYGIVSMGSRSSRVVKATKWFNLSVSQFESFLALDNIKFRAAAIQSLQRAILMDSSNPSYWTLMGCTYISLNARISQHFFIKATALNPKDGKIWNNLAVLYLNYGNYDISKEAFQKAQSVSPELAHSWIGDALMAYSAGDILNSNRLLAHAYVLANGLSSVAQLMYGMSIVNEIIRSNKSVSTIEDKQSLEMANFALKTYLKKNPNDEHGLLAACNIAERLGNYEDGEALATHFSKILELKYEESESESTLLKFVQTKMQLARFNLSNHCFAEALENLDIINILQEEKHELDDVLKCVLSQKVVLGLTQYFENEFDSAVQLFTDILTLSNENISFVILISQSLYSYGLDETKQAALEELFKNISKNGSSLGVLFTLATIAILENNTDILPTIQDELQTLPLSLIKQDVLKMVPKFIEIIYQKLNTNFDPVSIWQKQVVLFPDNYKLWSFLNNEIAKEIAFKDSSLISSSDLSTLCCKSNNLRSVQRAIVLDPLAMLKYVRFV